jgi:acyl-coenzyme A synthetase/AMP-(fatty) acid ligase/acyl carrier protein
MIVGGEKANPAILEKWRATGACDTLEWFNTYGPTEATVTASSFRVVPGEVDEALAAILPIGRPIDSFRLFVLDANLHPVPVGVVGELCIGGVAVARGYLGRPARSAVSFVPDPFAGPAEAGARLYRTADKVRCLPDGNIEFIGRTDFQVKIRGFRVETGEIETALSSHPAVAQCAVTVFEPKAGDRRLVGYYTAPDGPLAVSALQSYLGERLPEYMVPGLYVHLEALPLTPGGKVHRRALPPPELAGEEAGADYVAPASGTETELAAVWAEVLGREGIGRNDDFFELGGHSLLATQVVSRIRDTFAVDLPLRALFEAPRLAELAARLELLRASQDGTAVSPAALTTPTSPVPFASGVP